MVIPLTLSPIEIRLLLLANYHVYLSCSKFSQLLMRAKFPTFKIAWAVPLFFSVFFWLSFFSHIIYNYIRLQPFIIDVEGFLCWIGRTKQEWLSVLSKLLWNIQWCHQISWTRWCLPETWMTTWRGLERFRGTRSFIFLRPFPHICKKAVELAKGSTGSIVKGMFLDAYQCEILPAPGAGRAASAKEHAKSHQYGGFQGLQTFQRSIARAWIDLFEKFCCTCSCIVGSTFALRFRRCLRLVARFHWETGYGKYLK